MLFYILSVQKQYTDLTKDFFNPDHVYQIRGLETPLFCDQVGMLTRLMGVTHAGLGFVDMTDPKANSFVFEYNVAPGYVLKPIDFFRPRTVFNESTLIYDFIWDLQVAVIVTDFINSSKCAWETQVVVASGVSGKILNAWQHDYAEWYARTFPYYTIFEMWFEDNHERFDDLHGNQCHDFKWWGMQHLQNTYQVQFNGKEIHRDYMWNRLTRGLQTPKRLNATDKADNLFIKEFYDKFNKKAENLSDEEFISQFRAGKLFMNGAHQSEFVNMLQHDYYHVVTQEKIIWDFETKTHVVPGTD
ncbi:Conserved_hypothetical protein [Hexamita inflata]|uniref:Uncharacterized protein n=1 Tax=Hexamita inflata TaxID=28002 RepID=A0AA86NC33_9EUKA|nr:Conserved hypothetical protein [Hexamita inflata]